MRIYIIPLLVLVLLAVLAGCQGRQEAAQAPAPTVAPATPRPTTMPVVTEDDRVEVPAATPSPSPTLSGGPRSILSMGEQYRYGPTGYTIEASVYRYRYLDRYSWWDPNWGKFFTEVPTNASSRFLFLFLSLENEGSQAQWIPSPDAVTVSSPATGSLVHRTYWNASYYNEFENKTFRHDYPWVRELGVNDRDYEYIREYGFQGEQGGGFLWPGSSNAIHGYLVYEVPRDLRPEDTMVSIWFNNQSWATWRLEPSAGTGSPGLLPDFSVSIPSGPWPLPVQFTDATRGSPDSWSWDFGDNETSTDRNPYHVYPGPGSYPVSLTVRNANGVNSTVKRPGVVVWGDPPANTSHSVSFATGRGGVIADGSYLVFLVKDGSGHIRMNGTGYDLPDPSLVGLLFHGKYDGEIGVHGYRFENLSHTDVTLFINGSAVDRGYTDSISVPVSDFTSALTYALSPSRGLVSFTWDDQVILQGEDYSSFTLKGVNLDLNGDLAISVGPTKTAIRGNASAYSMPDITIGGM